jgi:hypothetical protein
MVGLRNIISMQNAVCNIIHYSLFLYFSISLLNLFNLNISDDSLNLADDNKRLSEHSKVKGAAGNKKW